MLDDVELEGLDADAAVEALADFLARRLGEILSAQEFIGLSLLTGRYTIEGGAIAVPKNDVLRTDRAAETVNPGAEYKLTPLSAEQLTQLVAQLGMPVRSVMRSKETLYQTLVLDSDRWTEAQLIAQIAQHPELLNRPIVMTPRGALLCRPPERVLDLLPLV